jgi:type II secretory pathway predicted ATPase ExeA
MSLDQLQGHFGFSRLPFSRQIPSARLFRSRAHGQASARIAFVIAHGQIGLICGEVGSGKTTALRAAVEPLDRSRHTVCYLPNPAVGERGIYQGLIHSLGGRVRFHKSELINTAYELIEREADERQKQVVLAIDEAHLLTPSQLEELRMLTNCQMDSRSPLSLILLGQPQLRRYLRVGTFAALISGSRCATSFAAWTAKSPPRTSPTTSRSPGALTAFTQTTRWTCCTRPHAGCRAR